MAVTEAEVFDPEKEQFFAHIEAQDVAITYDDVRLRTRHNRGNPLPDELDLTSYFSANVPLKVPFVSAAMTSVTEAKMAIAMGKEGGIGVIHGAMSIEEQYEAVRDVKLDTNALIAKPETVKETMTLNEVMNFRERKGHDFHTFPVVDSDMRFVGLITQSHFRFNKEKMDVPIAEIMTPAGGIITLPKAITPEKAYEVMVDKWVQTLPIVTKGGRLKGMYIFSDVDRIFHDVGQYNVDANGQLYTAAAVSTGEDVYERVAELEKYLDVVVIDTADGDADHVFTILENLKSAHPGLDVVVGNISDGESAYELAEAGADGIKVGQGPGAICSTRSEIGIGMPQIWAVWDCVRSLRRKPHIPVCADGGITNRGDFAIAIAAGAHSVMMGKMLAGTTESPGPVLQNPDKSRYKEYWGMGSRRALEDRYRGEAAQNRYRSGKRKLIVPEGVEAKVPYEGDLSDVLGLCIAALEKSMRYAKSRNIQEHRLRARLKRITGSGLRESHPHDVEVITR